MKLNNKGWSMAEMIFLMSVLIFFLLIVVFLVHKLYSSIPADSLLKNDSNLTNYYEYEMIDAGKEYYEKYYVDSKITDTSSVIITLKNLVTEKYIEQYNENDVPCTGYVVVKKVNKSLTYKPYLACKEYQTKGYSEIYDVQ